jgi:hypothetical protein
VLKIVKIIRVARVARIGRLFRAFPEIMLIVRSLTVVCRTVSVIIFVLTAIMYIFAILLIQLSKGTHFKRNIFKDVPTAMLSLTLGAIFPDMADLTNELGAENPGYAVLFLTFTILSTIIVMNMLIGSFVEVVSTVAAVEREACETRAIADELANLLGKLDTDQDGTISRREFVMSLEGEAANRLYKVGVDPLGLVETADILFKDRQDLKYEELFDILLSLRSNNHTKVKDLTDMRRYLHADLMRLGDMMQTVQNLQSFGSERGQPFGGSERGDLT